MPPVHETAILLKNLFSIIFKKPVDISIYLSQTASVLFENGQSEMTTGAATQSLAGVVSAFSFAIVQKHNYIMKTQRSFLNEDSAWQFTAGLRDFRNQSGKAWPGKREVFRTDTLETLAICSPSYQLVQHQTAIETAESALKQLGHKSFKRKVATFDNGGEIRATFDLLNGKAKSEVQVGEALGFRLHLTNSLNGRKTLWAYGGILDLICSNGMIGIKRTETAFDKKHNGTLSMDAYKESFKSLLKAYSEDVSSLKKLNGIKFKHADGLNMIGHLIKDYLKSTKDDSIKLVGYFNDPDSGMLPKFRGKKLHGTARGMRTAWHVYSAATALLRDREEEGRLDDVVNKRQSLANLFGGIASGKREIKPLLLPRADLKIEELAL